LGLSYVVDLLAGVITGGAYQFELKSMYQYPADPSNTAHFMIVINPRLFLPEAVLAERLQAYVQTIRESPMWDDEKDMMLPGEIEFRTAVQRRETGLPIPQQLYTDLCALGREMGVPVVI
jgi:L-2-hydroxycarboxylate dehydrogenase (NAD+)